MLISSDLDPDLHMALTVVASVAVVGSLIGIATKMALTWVLPAVWKSCLWLHDVATLSMSLGLLLAAFYIDTNDVIMCKVAGELVT